jgi:hypothetical protein
MHKSLAIVLQTVELLLFKHRGYLSKADGTTLSFLLLPPLYHFI